MTSSSRLLVVEDDAKDMKRAAEVAKLAGFSEVEGKSNPKAAERSLEERLAHQKGLPDGILLDLDFGDQSGYELLRFLHSNAGLRSIPIVVWSVLGEEQKELCRLFQVRQYVGKWEGDDALREALQRVQET